MNEGKQMKKIILPILVTALAIFSVQAQAGDRGGKRHAKILECLDTNEDGAISLEEYLAKHEERFSDIDEDGDQSLSAEELETIHKGKKGKRRKYYHGNCGKKE